MTVKLSSMNNLLIHVCLLSVLQTGVSSDERLSLNCNDTVQVEFGESVTINCSIQWKTEHRHDLDCVWESNNVSKCDTNMCKCDSRTVSLTISEVVKEETVIVTVFSSTGSDHKSVRVLCGPGPGPRPITQPMADQTRTDETRGHSKIPPVIIVVGVLLLLLLIIVAVFVIRNFCSRDQKEAPGCVLPPLAPHWERLQNTP